MFTFSKRFARAPESAVVGLSLSCVARDFVAIARDRRRQLVSSQGLAYTVSFEVRFFYYLFFLFLFFLLFAKTLRAR